MSGLAAALHAAAIRPALRPLRKRRAQGAADGEEGGADSAGRSAHRRERSADRPPSGSPLRARAAGMIIALIVLIVVAVVAISLLSGGGSATEAQLSEDRAQLALVSKELYAIEGQVNREVAASKAAWPLIASGLPAKVDRHLLSAVSTASAAASALPSPKFLKFIHELTGPAARIAHAYLGFMLLSSHGWAHVLATAEAISKGQSAATFDRATSGLYIDSIYNGSFTLSLIGEKVFNSYERLGETTEFGSALTPSEVQSLESELSPEADVLSPHEWRKLQVQR